MAEAGVLKQVSHRINARKEVGSYKFYKKKVMAIAAYHAFFTLYSYKLNL